MKPQFVNYLDNLNQIDEGGDYILTNVKQQNDNDLSTYSKPKVNGLNYWENKGYELGLGVQDKTEDVKRAKYVIDYMGQTFEHAKTSEYLNENQNKLWFWENIAFLFSVGKIFRDEDRLMFNEIVGYFDKDQNSFLPNIYKVYDWNDELIKKIEIINGIGNGNYHLMLIPFNMISDKKILDKAPEPAYKYFGPVNVFVDYDKMVEYMCEVMYKYGAIKTMLTDTVSNLLNIESKNGVNTYQHTVRVMNPSSSNPMLNTPMRTDRLGYFDINAEDNFELINPEQNVVDFAPHRYFLKPSDLNGDSKSDIYYRRPAKEVQRETLTNTGYNVKRHEGKKGLYTQIHSIDVIPNNYVDSQVKGGMLKVNTMYESTAEKEENPNYIVYSESDDIPIVNEREDIPILRYTQPIQDSTKIYKPKAENVGIFAH